MSTAIDGKWMAVGVVRYGCEQEEVVNVYSSQQKWLTVGVVRYRCEQEEVVHVYSNQRGVVGSG